MDPRSEIELCTDEEMTAVMEVFQSGDETEGQDLLDRLSSRYPNDARLPFLAGSVMASQGDYDRACRHMRRAVDLAPDFSIARFQLGFLQLSEGRAIAAQESWGPLHGLAADHYIRLFVDGLCALIRDDFLRAAEVLQHGITANLENPPLNNDIAMIIDAIATREAGTMEGAPPAMSSAQALLQQAALKSTKH